MLSLQCAKESETFSVQNKSDKHVEFSSLASLAVFILHSPETVKGVSIFTWSPQRKILFKPRGQSPVWSKGGFPCEIGAPLMSKSKFS